MHAVIITQGKQYRVAQGDRLVLDRVDAAPGSEVTIDKVLVVEKDGGETVVGKPYVSGAKVTLKVIEEMRGPKILIWKHRRRKNSRKRQGFRAEQSRVEVTAISA
ncbi:MAG: 50S ribosomal protein L21 [Deltaproteobacteria bacterium]|nr:50S ribosomal protein L21 [Deltaproteobacteria bacterium]